MDTTGALNYKVEHRHRYSDTAPSGFSMGRLGNVGVMEPPFSNQGWRLTNLYWRQRWNKGKVAVLAGFLDSTDFVDVFALGSPWLHFMNFAFSTGAATISLPEDAALGLAAGLWLSIPCGGRLGGGVVLLTLYQRQVDAVFKSRVCERRGRPAAEIGKRRDRLSTQPHRGCGGKPAWIRGQLGTTQ